MADAIFQLPPPPSASLIHLAIAEIVIYSILLPFVLFIAWKHGKNGMVCWPLLLSYFPLRFVSSGWEIANRNEPNIPNAAYIMTNAGSIVCLTLTIIGILYEMRWNEKIILGVTHITNTTGIAISCYGGAPSATGAEGVISGTLDRVGNLMMLAVLFSLCAWIWPTWTRVWAVPTHQNFRPALVMLMAATAALPYQLIRTIYSTTYAFDLSERTLDPIMGSFGTRFLLLFVPQLCVALVMVIGGLFGVCKQDSEGLKGSKDITQVHTGEGVIEGKAPPTESI